MMNVNSFDGMYALSINITTKTLHALNVHLCYNWLLPVQQGEGVLNYDSQKPGTKEALKNILFAMQSTMGTTASPATATTTVTPTSSQTQASGMAQSEQVIKKMIILM